MREEVEGLRSWFLQELESVRNESELNDLKGALLNKKRGRIPALFARLRDLDPQDRKAAGAVLNAFRQEVEDALKTQREKVTTRPARSVDLSLPPLSALKGGIHPLTLARRRIETIFVSMGYRVAEGPELETPYHNFDALNHEPDHPARARQDTFYIHDDLLLRTHTSPVQIRTMMRHDPPIKIIAPGRVFRRDDDLSHSPMFHQVEGLCLGENITMAHLKWTLKTFYSVFFRREVRLRLRPSYFPFTEPSLETDLGCVLCGGGGCGVCKQSGWLEVGGSGMVDPAVLDEMDVDTERYSGFAFGLGIDRMAMLLFQIPAIKMLFENDPAFLEAFS